MKPFAQSLLALWRELGLNQRVSLIVAALAVAGVVTGLVIWSRQPDYQLLYGRLAEKDAAAIVSALQAQGIKHKVMGGGGTIYGPADQVHRLRMELAGKGLPGGEGVGFGVGDGGFDAGGEGAHDVCWLVCEGFAGFELKAGSGCQKGEESADVCRGDAASAGGAVN
jgi:hypothetical protein